MIGTDDRAFGADDVVGTLYTGERLRKLRFLVTDNILPCTVKKWRDRGLLRAHRYNDKGECLYESPDVLLPGKFAHKRSYLAGKGEVVMHAFNEVQCEA